ncbi:hypothetical protein GWI34_03110 [Actinomadura sp. DSM 109109]|nr:hypothetical protein [Actinomadura lepetitiana]
MRSRRDQEAQRLKEIQDACAAEAKEYEALAERATDPIVRAGAEDMAAMKKRQAGQTHTEAMTDPENTLTPMMRAARQALKDGA